MACAEEAVVAKAVLQACSHSNEVSAFDVVSTIDYLEYYKKRERSKLVGNARCGTSLQ
jgi:hypothetical protein